ncbi:glycosyltransferase family 2 protein [Chloroflexota bacterium]
MTAERQPSVALIIPVYNSREHTREFLESAGQLAWENYRVIIVDDGSTDGTGEMLREKHPDVILISGDGNLWSSGAINLGIERAVADGFDYALIIDNDIVMHAEFVSRLVAAARDNPRTITVPKVYQYYDPQRLESAGYHSRKFGLEMVPTGEGEIDSGQYDQPRDLPCAMTMMLVDTAFFAEIGLFDAKNLPLYGADMDFTMRARRKGFRIIYEPHSILWHKRHTSARQGIPGTATFWGRLKYLTASPRSSLNFRLRVTVSRRHDPWYLIPVRALIYLRLLLHQALTNDLS